MLGVRLWEMGGLRTIIGVFVWNRSVRGCHIDILSLEKVRCRSKQMTDVAGTLLCSRGLRRKVLWWYLMAFDAMKPTHRKLQLFPLKDVDC